MYGGARLTVWQVVIIGAAWIALGIVLHGAFDWDAPSRVHYRSFRSEGVSSIFHSLKLWITGPVAIGLFHWYRAHEAWQAAKGETLVDADEPAPAPKKPQKAAPLPSPPRLGDDPFREPPRPHIAVVRHDTQPVAAPIVPGDPDDKPKLLT